MNAGEAFLDHHPQSAFDLTTCCSSDERHCSNYRHFLSASFWQLKVPFSRLPSVYRYHAGQYLDDQHGHSSGCTLHSTTI
uniref:Helicase, putative n=1 Tax=Arundo donax TaxID=35708 RepID=A0A0A9GX82_ARUDO